MKPGMAQRLAPLAVMLAGVLWGSLGVFVRALASRGLTTMQFTFLRCAFTALFLFIYLFFFRRGALKIKAGDIKYVLGTGVLSVAFFSACYAAAIERISLSAAAILLYTAPVIVTLLSAIFLGERLSAKKLAALLLAVGGCALVSGAGGVGAITPAGFFFGVCSGAGYALYSVLGKLALRRMGVWTLTFYTFVMAAVCTLPFAAAGGFGRMNGADAWGVVLLMGIVTGVLPYALYTLGLSRMEAGRASALACVEPVTAAMLGFFFYHEIPTLFSLIGAACVLCAVLLLSLARRG